MPFHYKEICADQNEPAHLQDQGGWDTEWFYMWKEVGTCNYLRENACERGMKISNLRTEKQVPAYIWRTKCRGLLIIMLLLWQVLCITETVHQLHCYESLEFSFRTMLGQECCCVRPLYYLKPSLLQLLSHSHWGQIWQESARKDPRVSFCKIGNIKVWVASSAVIFL